MSAVSDAVHDNLDRMDEVAERIQRAAKRAMGDALEELLAFAARPGMTRERIAAKARKLGILHVWVWLLVEMQGPVAACAEANMRALAEAVRAGGKGPRMGKVTRKTREERRGRRGTASA